jgi:putative nucleotidyltransferase with HDIG domain
LSHETTISIEQVLTRVDNLPTLNTVALRVGELVNDPRASARDVATVMSQDPSLSSKVLRLVNSSYYAIPGGVTDVARAISFVGFHTLHQLVLSVSVLRALQTPTGNFDACGLWLHSLAVGSCADVIARRIGHRDPGACFTAGLLHDLGKIALAITEPARFGAALETARAQGAVMSVSEQGAGLPSHDRVGSRLARRWRFPAPLLAAIEFHHERPGERGRRELAPSLQAMIDVVQVADGLVRSFHIGDGGSPAPEHHDEAALARLGLSTLHVSELYSALMRRLESSKVFLDLIDDRGAAVNARGAGAR